MTITRQITACTQGATHTTTRHGPRRDGGRLLWELHTCHTHRHIAPQLAGIQHRDYSATAPVTGTPPRCGTLHDHQPIELAVACHTRIWLIAPAADGWLERLAGAADLAKQVQDPDADALAEIVSVAAQDPDDPAVQARVLGLLAVAETASVGRRSR